MEYNFYGNAPRAAAVKAAVEANGDVFTIWMTRSHPDADFDLTPASARQSAVESGCSGILIEGEIPAMHPDGAGGEKPNPQAVDWVQMIFQLHDLPIYKGVITNFAPFTHHDGAPFPEKAKPLIDAGWSCHPEAYDMNGDPTAWIGRRAFFASQLGWFDTQPALGVYDPPGGGGSLDAYPTRHDYRNWSVWAAENVL